MEIGTRGSAGKIQMKLRYADRAKDDVALAFAWYERQRHGLGYDFLDCVEAAVKSIIENSAMYRIYFLHFRGCLGLV